MRECLNTLHFGFPSTSFFVICFVTLTDSFLNSHRNSEFLPRVPHLSFTDVYRSLDSLTSTNSVHVSLSKLQEIVKDREAWPAAVHGVANSRTRLSNWTTTVIGHIIFAKYYIGTFTELLWCDPPSNFINSTSQICQFPKWQPTPVFLPGKSHGRRRLVGYSPWSHKESDTTEWLHFTSNICQGSESPPSALQHLLAQGQHVVSHQRALAEIQPLQVLQRGQPCGVFKPSTQLLVAGKV